jgi:hypothetical protein
MYFMPCQSYPTWFDLHNVLLVSTNRETPHCVIFFNLLLISISENQVIFSALCTQTLIICTLPLGWNILHFYTNYIILLIICKQIVSFVAYLSTFLGVFTTLWNAYEVCTVHQTVDVHETTQEQLGGFSWILILENSLKNFSPSRLNNLNDHFTWRCTQVCTIFWV